MPNLESNKRQISLGKFTQLCKDERQHRLSIKMIKLDGYEPRTAEGNTIEAEIYSSELGIDEFSHSESLVTEENTMFLAQRYFSVYAIMDIIELQQIFISEYNLLKDNYYNRFRNYV